MAQSIKTIKHHYRNISNKFTKSFWVRYVNTKILKEKFLCILEINAEKFEGYQRCCTNYRPLSHRKQHSIAHNTVDRQRVSSSLC